jgi:hypothetical protein
MRSARWPQSTSDVFLVGQEILGWAGSERADSTDEIAELQDCRMAERI